MRNKYIEEIDVMLMDGFLRWRDDMRKQEDRYSKEDIKSFLALPESELMEMYLFEVRRMAAKRND